MRKQQAGMVKSLTRMQLTRRFGTIMHAFCAWLLLALSVILTPGLASGITIDFDSLPGMPNSPGLAVPLGSRLSNQLQPTTGAVFSSAVGYVAVVDILTCCGPNHAISNPNGIGGANNFDQLSYGTPITVTFFDLGNPSLQAVTDFVSIRGDQIPIPGTATLEAFDVSGISLGSMTANDIAGGLTVAFSQSGIHSIKISETSATIAFDNLSFNTPIPVNTPVPEPASLGLVSLGLLGLLRYWLAWRTWRGPNPSLQRTGFQRRAAPLPAVR